jgi:hypothetical protein
MNKVVVPAYCIGVLPDNRAVADPVTRGRAAPILSRSVGRRFQAWPRPAAGVDDEEHLRRGKASRGNMTASRAWSGP